MTLLMCGEEEGFNELPSGVKSCWTKTFNKMTASSIKRVKFKKWQAPEREGNINGENFDPERQSQASDDKSESEEETKPEEEVKVMTKEAVADDVQPTPPRGKPFNPYSRGKASFSPYRGRHGPPFRGGYRRIGGWRGR